VLLLNSFRNGDCEIIGVVLNIWGSMKIQSLVLILSVTLTPFYTSYALGSAGMCQEIFTLSEVEPPYELILADRAVFQGMKTAEEQLQSAKSMAKFNEAVYLMVEATNAAINIIASNAIAINSNKISPAASQLYSESNRLLAAQILESMSVPAPALKDAILARIMSIEKENQERQEDAKQRTQIGFMSDPRPLVQRRLDFLMEEIFRAWREHNPIEDSSERGPLGFTAKVVEKHDGQNVVSHPIGFLNRSKDDILPAESKEPIGFVHFKNKDPNSLEPNLDIILNFKTGDFEIIRQF
jgi:hypothetical protein